MALEDLVQKIIHDAEDAAGAIRAAADRSIETIEREACAREEEYRVNFTRETESLLAKEREFIGERIRRDAQMVLEKERRRILDSVFLAAEKELASVDAETYRSFVRVELERIAPDLSNLDTFYGPSDRCAILEAEVRSAGSSATVQASDEVPAGFLAVGPTCEYDMRFGRLVLQLKRSCEPEIAEALFSS